MASARVQVAQAAQDYEQAVQDLADAEVKSPIDGVVAKDNQKVGYAASASDSDANSIATIITDQQLAVISLNEVDIAKVKVGQQASLSFTAIDGLKLTGQVAADFNLVDQQDKKNITKVVSDGLYRLKSKYRDILILKYVEEKNYQEISDIIRKPLGTVGSMLNRAKLELKKVIDYKQIL